MKKRLICIVTGILCALVLSACGNKNSQPKEEPAVHEETEAIPEAEVVPEDAAEAADTVPVFGEFLAINTDGEEVTQEIFAQAELTMVNIWGTFCGPCIMEMPDLGEIAREYEGSGFQIVGIITDIYEYGDETVAEIIEVTGADYTHLLLSVDLYNNYLNQVQVVPTTVFVDDEGKEVAIYTGSRSKEDWTAIIEELRAQVTAANE